MEHINRLMETNKPKAIEYLKQYFIPLDNEMHAIFDGEDDFTLVDHARITYLFFNRMHRDLHDFYFNTYTGIRFIVYEDEKPRLFDDKFNMCKCGNIVTPPEDATGATVETTSDVLEVIDSEIQVADFLQRCYVDVNKPLREKPADLFRLYSETPNSKPLRKLQFMTEMSRWNLATTLGGKKRTNYYSYTVDALKNELQLNTSVVNDDAKPAESTSPPMLLQSSHDVAASTDEGITNPAPVAKREWSY